LLSTFFHKKVPFFTGHRFLIVANESVLRLENNAVVTYLPHAYHVSALFHRDRTLVSLFDEPPGRG
jgi:hypothetical protein